MSQGQEAGKIFLQRYLTRGNESALVPLEFVQMVRRDFNRHRDSYIAHGVHAVDKAMWFHIDKIKIAQSKENSQES